VQRLLGFSDENARDVIRKASVSTTPVRNGDIIVLGSDGLFDNLRDEDIQRVVERRIGSTNGSVPHRGQLQQAAGALVDAAISNVNVDSAGTVQMDPWQVPGKDVPANNADDTTALVAVVVAADASSAAPRDSAEPLESCAGVINF
jgi:protein phosphatase PTC7